jgi:uncharacterized membrane protein HdeD (DUF308 family)
MQKEVKMAKKSMCMHKKMGAGMLVLGVLVLVNVYWPMIDWGTFIGAVLILGGLCKLLMPHKHSE